MIRLTIQRKVFLATFVLAAAMAILLTALYRRNLEKGFRRYVVEAEMARLDWLVTNIETAYGKKGSWNFLRESTEPWDRAAEEISRLEGQGQPRHFDDGPPPGFDQRPPPPVRRR